MEGFTDSKATLSPERLEAISNTIERACMALIGVHELLAEGDDDNVCLLSRFAIERAVQMLDGCCGALAGSAGGSMGNFRPENDIRDEVTRLREARS